jgi:hypothetical protein
MACYMIGIGGTGARCIEAAAHLSAAGLFPDTKLYTLFVDPDESNGNLERAKVTLDLHIKGQKMALGSSSLLQTRVQRGDPAVWSPFGGTSSAEAQLRKAFSYSQIKAQNEEIAGLFDALYSKNEKKADLSVGFRGHPSIGAALMAQQLSLSDVEPWDTFRALVTNDTGTGKTPRIFLCGSVFGGTGAAGLPTIGKLVRQELQEKSNGNFEISAGLVLPYFSFEGTPQDEDLKAQSEHFIPNTQSALKYYWNKRHDDIFDGMYVVGDPDMSPVGEASVGGPRQENKSHFVELLVALGAADFFHSGHGTGHVALMSREDSAQLRWGDLPHPGSVDLRRRLSQLVHFAFAYVSTYKPALGAIRQGERSPYAFPWYIDLIKQPGADLSDNQVWEQLENTESYARQLLRWTASIHRSASGTDVSLFDHSTFARPDPETKQIELRDESEFRRGRFGVLDRPGREGETQLLAKVWEQLSGGGAPTGTSGAGGFLRALHEACDPDQFSV